MEFPAIHFFCRFFIKRFWNRQRFTGFLLRFWSENSAIWKRMFVFFGMKRVEKRKNKIHFFKLSRKLRFENLFYILSRGMCRRSLRPPWKPWEITAHLFMFPKLQQGTEAYPPSFGNFHFLFLLDMLHIQFPPLARRAHFVGKNFETTNLLWQTFYQISFMLENTKTLIGSVGLVWKIGNN